MNEDTLRKWVNDELVGDEELAVYRWMVLCTSPELPTVLDGLIRERKEREADARLLGLGSFWSRLVERWDDLVNSAQAGWVGPGVDLAPASVDGPPMAPWARLTDDLYVEVEVGGLEVAVYISTDAPAVRRLSAEATNSTRFEVAYAGESRPTIWAVRGAALPVAQSAQEQLALALAQSDVEVLGIRWQD